MAQEAQTSPAFLVGNAAGYLDFSRGHPRIIGVKFVRFEGSFEEILCFEVRYSDGETHFVPHSTVARGLCSVQHQ